MWVCVQSLSCIRLFCNPMDYNPSSTSVHGILQARMLEYTSVTPFRRNERAWKEKILLYRKIKGKTKYLYNRRNFEPWNPFLDFCYSQIEYIEGKLWCCPTSYIWQAVRQRFESRLSDYITYDPILYALELYTWRIPGTGEPGGLPSQGLHRVRHDWSNLAAAAAT